MPGKLESWVPREHERHLFHEVYIDETSQNDHHFLVLGGIMLPREASADFEADMLAARSPRLLKLNSRGFVPEMGWSEVSNGDFVEYHDVLEAYFSFAQNRLRGRRGLFKFYCSVVNLRVPGRHYTGKKGQIGFNREIYFHCMNVGRRDTYQFFHVYPDYRSTNQPVEKMALMLTRGLRKEGDQRDHPFRRVTFRESHTCHALQISDIVIGALAYRLNRHYDKPNANADKKRLCDYVLEKTGFAKLIFADHFKQKRWGQFQLWFRRHKS